MGTVTYKKKAIKYLRKMPKELADSFRAGFKRIAAGNETGLSIKPLQGRPGFRLKIGDYRGIFEKEGDDINILVLSVGPRGDVYK